MFFIVIEMVSYHLYLFYLLFPANNVFWESSVLVCDVTVIHLWKLCSSMLVNGHWVILETAGLAATHSCMCYGCSCARSGNPGTYGIGLFNFTMWCQVIKAVSIPTGSLHFYQQYTRVPVVPHTCQRLILPEN